MILVCQGTRPEQLKLNPIVRLARQRGLPIHLHCTNQSPDLLDPTMEPWDSVSRAMQCNTHPRLVVVQGDTRTAFEVAVMSFELGIPVFHVEAGVRTYDLSSPWPEEGYRQMISRIATYHACTTQHNADNLTHGERRWGTEHDWDYGAVPVEPSQFLRVTGSPIVESVRERGGTNIFPAGSPHPVILTLHRRENRGHFDDILHGVDDARQGFSLSVFPSWIGHPNGWAAQENTTRLRPLSPISADAMADSIRHAACVVTDSGGMQEECNVLGVPCVVARTITDRPESLGKGGAILAGNTREGVSKAIREALAMDRTQIQTDCYGDGKASERICDWFAEILEAK